MQNKLYKYLFYFLIAILILQILGNRNQKTPAETGDVLLSSKNNISIGSEVKVNIKNNTDNSIYIEDKCPNNPLKVTYYNNGEWIEKTNTLKNTDDCNTNFKKELKAGGKRSISFGLWNHALFNQIGKYKISYTTKINKVEKEFSVDINIKQKSLIKKIWNETLYKPIFNSLLFLLSKVTNGNLGFAVIILTLIIKLILLIPNQKALKAQKTMQKVQPQLDALKIKYKDDPQRLSKETMEIWKKYKVNPMGSCLPMLIQFPILIALFYVVKNGLTVFNPEIIYPTFQNFDLQSINPIFLGLIDLTKVNIIAMPIIIGGLQFFQIKLSFAKKSKTKEKNNQTAMMNNMMQYFMPAMIAVFTASLPAVVALYWGTSTLFSIGQQIAVNKKIN